MKVLFAVNNEKISESIIKTYQANYKEIISAKNVYYFNAIIKELQRDKSYDRVVISEDLEPFSNRNNDTIDKFIFEELDKISDEASNTTEGEIPIIVICTDRREKSDAMLGKLFSIGIYSALIGQDRVIEKVCKLIYTPRTKKEAKLYYRIDADDADYKNENTESVSEVEIQNIIMHYKRLGKNEERYVESFNDIANQYTNEQLKLIVKFLPLGVKAVLEEKCPKYQEIMIGSVKGKIKEKQEKAFTTKNIKTNNGSFNNNRIDIINRQLKANKLTKPVIIPATVDVSNVKKVYNNVPNTPTVEEIKENIDKLENNERSIIDNTATSSVVENTEVQPVKRGRGRPAKVKPEAELSNPVPEPVKRGRGRPRKVNPEDRIEDNTSAEDVDLFSLGSDDSTTTSNELKEDYSATLPGLDDDSSYNGNYSSDGISDDTSSNDNNNTYQNNAPYRPSFKSTIAGKNDFDNPTPAAQATYKNDIQPANNYYNSSANTSNTTLEKTNRQVQNVDLGNVLTSNKKVVAFVGTSKNGTSFLVNNLALLLSSKGINTAILDLTKNKNAYYIFTQNDENLRNKALRCIETLRMGETEGIQVNKNLTVYTTAPNEDSGINDCENILQTLVKNYSLVLLDCDFNTDYSYFSAIQELYIVQTYDILTIQPLTAFLRELSDRELLPQEKLRIVINKALRVRNLNDKMIVGGISSYNDPEMSYMKELFNKDTVIYTTVPFEDQTYAKYLEGLVTCELSLNGYSKGLLESLVKLGNMVYPLISNNHSSPKNYNNYAKDNKNTKFGSSIDDTLNRMRNNY